jgi:hypothetical protein
VDAARERELARHLGAAGRATSSAVYSGATSSAELV